jgi:hypothetical protein
MRALREIKIGIRLQSSIVIVLTAFWWCDAWICYHTHGSNHSLFWAEAFLCLPFLTFILAAFLLFTHIKCGHSYRSWVYAAILTAASSWYWLWIMFLFAA